MAAVIAAFTKEIEDAYSDGEESHGKKRYR
jgi:hypothetical protein